MGIIKEWNPITYIHISVFGKSLNVLRKTKPIENNSDIHSPTNDILSNMKSHLMKFISSSFKAGIST
jgi:hypothetical protein